MSLESKFNELKDSITRLINTLRKYNIRYVAHATETTITIAFDLVDIYRTVCRQISEKYPIKCMRVRGAYAYIYSVPLTSLDSVKAEIQMIIDNFPYQLHPEFSIRVSGSEANIVVAILDSDVVNAVTRNMTVNVKSSIGLTVEPYVLNGDTWIRLVMEFPE